MKDGFARNAVRISTGLGPKSNEMDVIANRAQVDASLKDYDGEFIDVQNPLPTNGDSVYCKDIDESRSDITGWTGSICDFFNDLHTEVYNASTDNPKTILIHFKRSTIFPSMAFGSSEGGNFSNIKIIAVTSGDIEIPIFDETSDNTKYTSKVIRFGMPVGMNALKIQFHTGDRVGLTNIFIPKMSEMVVNADNEHSPIHVNDTDHNRRTALNSVFGDRLIGQRKPSLAAQFQYGLAGDDADVTIVGSGAYTIEESLLKLNTGTDSNGSVIIQSTNYVRYIPGHEAYLYFTYAFTQGVANSYQYAGLYDDNDGYYIGFNGTDFIAGRRRNGTDYQQTIDITKVLPLERFDPTKGNVYAITFGYLGFAPINFSVLDSDGIWRNIARIEYPNTERDTHITQTNLPVRAEVTNTGNTTDLEALSGSLSAGIVDGAGADPSVRSFTYKSGLIPLTATGNVLIVAFRSKTTYNSIENRISSLLTLISAATDISKIAQWSLYDNPPYTGGTWTSVNTDSVLEYSTDTTITSFTGKTFIDWTMSRLDTFFENVKDFNLLLRPGRAAAFVLQVPGGTNGDVNLSIRWDELF
jgi:hypothetical protein